MEKKTPLYAMHEKYQGKIVPFAGYLLPVQYPNGILHEHRLVREKAGLFDVSHMGEFTLKGPDALSNLNRMLTNSYDTLADGRARYGIMCYENGTAVDDLLVYKMADNDYYIVVNASNTDKDFEWMKGHLEGDAVLKNISDEVSQMALQGPLAETIIRKLTDRVPEKNYSFINHVDIGGYDILLSRTGYTGEDGFEIYCKNGDAEKLWELLLETGKEEGLEPCGLGARDTLRLEAAMPLYGHELSDEITPAEANLGFFIKMDKDFIGREYLTEPMRTRIGLVMTDKGIAREHCDVYHNGTRVGYVTSGTFSPTLNKAIAMALVDIEYACRDQFEVDVRGRKIKADKTVLPFYSRKGRK